MISAIKNALFLALLTALASTSCHAAPVAQQINAGNASRLNSAGPDAIGGIDDWYLSNGVLCAVISDPEHEHEFSARGGSLVDLGFCGRADDHYTFSQDLLDGSRTKPFNAQHISTEIKPGSASIIVVSQASGANMETRYTLDDTDPTELKISKRLTVIEPELADFNLVSLGSFNYHSMEPFVLASQALDQSPGFANVDFVSRGTSAIREAAHNADTLITLSPPDAEHPITYGWRLVSAQRVDDTERKPLPRFVLADEESIAMLVLTNDFWIGDGQSIGWLQLPQIPLLGMNVGTTIELEERIYVGPHASISSVTDQIFSKEPIISGEAEPGSAIHLHAANGAGITHQRIGSDGQFSFRMPEGNYVVKQIASANRATSIEFEHSVNGSKLGPLVLPKAPTLSLPRGSAMRLVFEGINGTQRPDFSTRLTNFSVSDDDGTHTPKRINQIFLAGIESDPSEVELAAGNYRVYATRGPEYSVESTEISIAAGETKALSISTPKRELLTPGFIAADFHVHAGDSFDNTFSNQERVRTFVAEHGEIMVNSEHDTVVDFAPLVEAMGVADKITSFTGAEITSILPTEVNRFTGGHMNFFPYQPKPLQYRNGMINHEGRRWRDIMHDVKAQNPGAIAQLNHPRRNLSLSNGAPDNFEELIDNGAFLDHMGSANHPYNPNQALTTAPNSVLIDKDPTTGWRDLDFDAVEIVNPGGEFHEQRITAVRKDWMSFLLQGEHITGTANSDSHHSGEQVAVPRNMVAVSNDDVNDYNRSEFMASIKQGNLYGTTGPMLDLKLADVSMGGTYVGNNAELTLAVDAASWVSLERADIQVNGVVVEQLDLSKQRRHTIELEFKQDSLVTVEVHGPASETYSAIYPGLKPYAYSNPIYVDADSDGSWAAPGLSD